MAGSEPESASVKRLREPAGVGDKRKMRSRHVMIKSKTSALGVSYTLSFQRNSRIPAGRSLEKPHLPP